MKRASSLCATDASRDKFYLMNVALRRAMTVDEYLAWSERQSERWRTELINGQVVAMAPERVAHNRIKGAVYLALRRVIVEASLPCEAMTDGVAVRIDEHTAYEPDALVYCGKSLPGATMVVPNPMIIVEVLSPTTKHTDTSAKLIGYFKLPSVMHYLVIDPDARSVTHYTRDGVPHRLASGPLRLDPPGLVVTIEDLLGPA
jgi:Uma2 family endonuclease